MNLTSFDAAALQGIFLVIFLTHNRKIFVAYLSFLVVALGSR